MAEKEPVELITRYLSHEATPEEQQQLLDWVASDPVHQKIFQKYSTLWHSGKIQRVQPPDAERALSRMNLRIDAWEEEQMQKVRYITPWYKVAAAVALLAVAAGFLAVRFLTMEKPAPVAYVTKATRAGERIVVALPDGSRVNLNAHATLTYPETFQDASRREVSLTGEAFFDVQRDPSKPFVIHTGKLQTEVLGTSFNVDARVDEVAVSVATGKVKVSDGTASETLLPQEKVSYTTGSGKMKKGSVNIENEIAWTQNTIIFDDATLQTAALELEQWFDVKIQFNKASLRQCRITGTYKNETLPHVLEAIAFSTGVRYTIHEKVITLSGNGCGQ